VIRSAPKLVPDWTIKDNQDYQQAAWQRRGIPNPGPNFILIQRSDSSEEPNRPFHKSIDGLEAALASGAGSAAGHVGKPSANVGEKRRGRAGGENAKLLNFVGGAAGDRTRDPDGPPDGLIGLKISPESANQSSKTKGPEFRT
jgi:hypothetical protein